MKTLGSVVLVATLVASCGGARDPGEQTPRNLAEDEAFTGELVVELADTLVQAKAYENALPMLNRALAKTPQDARLHYLMGLILRDRAVYDEASKYLARAIELQPGLAPAHGAMGVLLDLQGQHEAARPFHERAVELDPTSARHLNNLGFSLYLAGKPAEAEAAYRRGLGLDPMAHRLFINLGFALAAQNQEDEALQIFRQALPDGAARNNLALARELRGDREAARRMYQEALLQSPALPQATANLQALERLNGAENAPPDAPPSGGQ